MSCYGLEFTAEENRLRNSSGEAPGEGIERTDAIKLRRSQSADAADRKTRQSGGARFVNAMKRGGETIFGRDHIGPAFEQLRGQTGGHGSRLAGE